MTDRTDASSPALRRRRAPIPKHFVLAAAVGVAFLYAGAGQPGKASAAEACAAARELAQKLAPLAKGEVAAMAIAKEPAPMTNVAFNGPSGERKTLADFKGKTLLLNLWATWCVPCRSEMGALDRLQARVGSDKFEVVAVNLDTARLDRPKAFLEEIGAKNLAFYADPKAEIFQLLKRTGDVLGLPTTFLIDPSGCRLGVMPGPAAWDSADGARLIDAALASPGAAP